MQLSPACVGQVVRRSLSLSHTSRSAPCAVLWPKSASWTACRLCRSTHVSARELSARNRALMRENAKLLRALTMLTNPNHVALIHTAACREDRRLYHWHPCQCGLDEAVELTKELLGLEFL